MDANQRNNAPDDPSQPGQYPDRLNIDYPERLNRLTTFFRVFTIIPIAIILGLIAGGGVMTVFGNLQMDGGVIPPWFGLTERINTYGYMLWVLAFAAILLRLKLASSNLADRKNIIVPDAITS